MMEIATVAAQLEAPFAACVQEIRIEPTRIVFLYDDLRAPVTTWRAASAAATAAPPAPKPRPGPRPPRQPRIWRETLPTRERRPEKSLPGLVEEHCRSCGQPFGVDRLRSWYDANTCGPCLAAQ